MLFHTERTGPGILLVNRINAIFRHDNNEHAEATQGQELRGVESDGIQLKSVAPVESDPDEKVNTPIQVSERERSSQVYKPSV